MTTFGALASGDDVNLEVDTMARYAARLIESTLTSSPCSRQPSRLLPPRPTTEIIVNGQEATQRAKSKAGAKATRSESAARILIVEARFTTISPMRCCAARHARSMQAGASYDVVTRAGRAGNSGRDRHRARCGESKRKPYDGVVALGCVIHGETYHFDIVANESARALMDLSVALRLPIGNGILTVDNEAQALGARTQPTSATKAARRRARRWRWSRSSARSRRN